MGLQQIDRSLTIGTVQRFEFFFNDGETNDNIVKYDTYTGTVLCLMPASLHMYMYAWTPCNFFLSLDKKPSIKDWNLFQDALFCPSARHIRSGYNSFLMNLAESVRGCYDVSKTLPGLKGARLRPARDCEFQPKQRSPVKVCMCNGDLCNDLEYDLHSERAKRLFNNRQQQILLNSSNNNNNNGGSLTYLNESGSLTRRTDGTVVVAQTVVGAFKEDEGEDHGDDGDDEDEEEDTIYYEDPRLEQEENLLLRIPRQINAGKNCQLHYYGLPIVSPSSCSCCCADFHFRDYVLRCQYLATEWGEMIDSESPKTVFLPRFVLASTKSFTEVFGSNGSFPSVIPRK